MFSDYEHHISYVNEIYSDQILGLLVAFKRIAAHGKGLATFNSGTISECKLLNPDVLSHTRRGGGYDVSYCSM